MHGALHAATHDRATAYDMDILTDRRGAQAVPRCQHRRVGFPAVSLRVIRFVLAVYPISTFTTHHEDLATIEDGAMAGTRRGQRPARLPTVLCRVVDVVEVGVRVERIDPSADEVH